MLRLADDLDVGCPVCGLKGCDDPAHGPAPDFADADAFTSERRIEHEINRERARREARRRLDAEARHPHALPELLTLRERLSRPRVATTWRVHGWQPCGARVMFAAQAKVGKTTVRDNLIRSLVDGDKFLDTIAVTPVSGTVAVVDVEMSTGQLVDWLAAQRIKGDDRVLVLPMRGRAAAFDLLHDGTRAEWAARLRAAQVDYVVLDCLRPILDALGLDEHRDAGRFLTAFDALLHEAGVTEALVIHHMGHTSERSRGDSRLRDWPDAEWRLVRQDENPASPRFLSAFGRDVEVPESQLTYDALTRRLSIVGGSRQDARTTGTLADVLDFLSTSPAPLSARAIENALQESHPRDRVRAALKAGIRDGAITPAPGARRAILHSVRECAGVRDQCTPRSANECAAAYIQPRTRALAANSLGSESDRALDTEGRP